MTLSDVQQHIARLLLPVPPEASLGSITLLPHQLQAVARLQRALGRYRGALLADDVGLGKTFTALAVARGYDEVHVLAPAGLISMWQAALLRTRQVHVRLHSLHAASRRQPDLAPASSRTLVIVDEAHALRHASTIRYRHVAAAVSGSHVLLLTATPLHNRRRELSTLVGLFLGERGAQLRDTQLSQLLVRRDARMTHAASFPPERAAISNSAERRTVSPAVRAHRQIVMPQQRATLDGIMSLPAPLPARDGAVAGALIRLGLLRAWCSSDAALTHALTRRLLRSEALRAALQSGRHPTQQELRAWAVGDGHVQLAFPELMTAPPPVILPPVETVQQHIEALHRLRSLHQRTASADSQRAQVLRALRQRHPDVPIVAFSQYTQTVQALYRALRDIAGVGAITGNSARIASGPVARTELLEHFAPRAHGRPPPPRHLAVTLLLTTDLLAEGVNLQDAGVVVHLDLPWTPALRRQRVGRAVRLGSPHAIVHVYRLAASRPLRRALRVEQRLARKLLLTQRFVGGGTSRAAPGSSAADRESAWYALLEQWATCNPGQPSCRYRASRIQIVAAHAVGTPEFDALVLVRRGERLFPLRIHRARGAWCVSVRTGALLRFAARVEAVRANGGDLQERPLTPQVGRLLQRLVARWHARRCAATLAQGHGNDDADVLRLTSTQRKASRWLQGLVATLTVTERTKWQEHIAAAQRSIDHAHGAAALNAMEEWMRTERRNGIPPAERLRRWHDRPELIPGSAGPRVSAMPCVIDAVIAVTLDA